MHHTRITDFAKLCGMTKPHVQSQTTFQTKGVAVQYVHNESHNTSSTLISALWKSETATDV